jgi:drug/metabolite transporter (DMT)-like permease
MTITNPIGGLGTPPARSTTGPTIALTGALAAAVVFAAVMQPSLAREALVPLTVSLIFVLAAGLALFAWLKPVPRRQFTYWDAAGVLTFIGICAAAAIEPEQMMQLVAGAERPR